MISWFQLQPGPTQLEVFALTGQRVAVLQEGPHKAGFHLRPWDGRDDQGRPLASGAYLCQAGDPQGGAHPQAHPAALTSEPVTSAAGALAGFKPFSIKEVL